MPQASIIDSIKKNIILRKRFRNKNRKLFTFLDIIKIAQIIFNKKITKAMFQKEFNYHYFDRNGKKNTVKYQVALFDQKNCVLEITRKSFDGVYKTTLELSKNKKYLYYFEAVDLKEPPFQIWGQVGRLSFKYHFRKRKKLIKKELYQNESCNNLSAVGRV